MSCGGESSEVEDFADGGASASGEAFSVRLSAIGVVRGESGVGGDLASSGFAQFGEGGPL